MNRTHHWESSGISFRGSGISSGITLGIQGDHFGDSGDHWDSGGSLRGFRGIALGRARASEQDEDSTSLLTVSVGSHVNQKSWFDPHGPITF